MGLDDAIKDAAAKQAAFTAADREADLAWAAQAKTYQARTAELTKDFLSRAARSAIPTKIVCWTEGHYIAERNWRGKKTGREWVQSGPHQGWQLAWGGGEDTSSLFMLATGEYFVSKGLDGGGTYSLYCIYGRDGKLLHCACTPRRHRSAYNFGGEFPTQYGAANGWRRFEEFEGHYLNPSMVEQSMAYFLVHRTPIDCSDLS